MQANNGFGLNFTFYWRTPKGFCWKKIDLLAKKREPKSTPRIELTVPNESKS